MKINKAKINFIVDALGLFAFMVVAITGFWRWWFLPDGGSGRGVAYELIELRRLVVLWHNYSGLVLTVVVVVHLLLHWNWIVCMVKSFFTGGQNRQS